jgi:hypothetical protein
MWRFLLAWKCFFLVLFSRRLPREAVELLPPDLAPRPRELPPPGRPAGTHDGQPKDTTRSEHGDIEGPSRGAIALLTLLQREGRLLDFLEEEIDAYPDAQIGAAVRDIHRGCKKALAEHMQLEPVLRDAENSAVEVPPGYSASQIRLVGNVIGAPPFHGTLRHPGWKGLNLKLPDLAKGGDPSVIAPAEVEL